MSTENFYCPFCGCPDYYRIAPATVRVVHNSFGDIYFDVVENVDYGSEDITKHHCNECNAEFENKEAQSD